MAARINPLITIAIPTFNRAGLLARAVKSALAQTHKNIEVLVCDNASTDDTQATLAGFDDGRLRVIRHPENIGGFPNWNTCLKLARGEYYVLLSDDDLVECHFVERAVGLLARAPNVPIVVGVCSEDRFGTFVKDFAATELKTGIYPGIEVLREYLSARIPVQNCTVLLNTAAARTAGGYQGIRTYTADACLWIPRLLAPEVGLIRDPCGTYTITSSNWTNQTSLQVRLLDCQYLYEFLASEIRTYVKNGTQRDELIQLLHWSFAQTVVSTLRQFKAQGGNTQGVIQCLYQFRHVFGPLSARQKLDFARPGTLAHLLLPRSMMRSLAKARKAFT